MIKASELRNEYSYNKELKVKSCLLFLESEMKNHSQLTGERKMIFYSYKNFSSEVKEGVQSELINSGYVCSDTDDGYLLISWEGKGA